MSKPRIILLGAGGHARSCIDVIEQQGLYKIFGLVGTKDEHDREILGYRVLADDENMTALRTSCDAVLVAVGQIESPTLRIKLFEKSDTTAIPPASHKVSTGVRLTSC